MPIFQNWETRTRFQHPMKFTSLKQDVKMSSTEKNQLLAVELRCRVYWSGLIYTPSYTGSVNFPVWLWDAKPPRCCRGPLALVQCQCLAPALSCPPRPRKNAADWIMPIILFTEPPLIERTINTAIVTCSYQPYPQPLARITTKTCLLQGFH